VKLSGFVELQTQSTPETKSALIRLFGPSFIIIMVLVMSLIIIIIIIAPHTMKCSNEDEWGDLECLYKARQTDTTAGGLFTDTSINE